MKRKMCLRLLECVCRALVDACTTVNTGVCVYDSDIIDSYCVLGTYVRASSASDTIVCFYFYHRLYLKGLIEKHRIIMFCDCRISEIPFEVF